MSRSSYLFLLSLALLSVSVPALASIIYVSGNQTGTWLADTVIVTAEVRVPPNMSLTILPGVEVLFSVYCKLIVDNGATLRAVGTAADSIRFDVLLPDSRWHGIRFLSASDSSRLEYCHLTHGMTTGSLEDGKGGAIYCSNSSPTISGNTISGNSAWCGGGISCNNGSNPSISGNTLSGNSAGNIGGGICCINSSPSINGNSLNADSAYSGGGIYCASNSSPTISGNTLSSNYTSSSGGGISCSASSPAIIGNTINGNIGNSGGGIYCHDSSPTISGNTLSGNAAFDGGGIWCDNSSPTISANTISGNSGSSGGGIYCGNNSSPSISGNTISGNSSYFGGGGIFCTTSSPSITGNAISANSTNDHGGGIYCYNGSNPSIIGNTISANSTNGSGGGVYIASAPAAFQLNEITENLATGSGGGLYLSGTSFTMNKNTIAGNTSSTGGGLYSTGSGTRTIINSIHWGNSPQQISGRVTVTYSDIQGGYTGTGNINVYPAFVDTAQGDYRLQWGSACIDIGDPNPIYNDPDGSRADMGAWYYDQSMPVRILLTPYNAPIQIPASGGSFQYAIKATNIATSPLLVPVWCNVTLPNGGTYGPVLGPVNVTLGSGTTLSRIRTQAVPAGAPAGLYHYNAFAVAMGDTSSDSFTFTKLGAGNRDSGFGGWTNSGEEFETNQSVGFGESDLPMKFGIAAFPNPFNPATVLSYQLPVASRVSLRVYDTAGRLVESLVEGWREAGNHEVTFDGSDMPSGIYIYRVTTGTESETGKMILLK